MPGTAIVEDGRAAANVRSDSDWRRLPPMFRVQAALHSNAVLLETAKPDGGGERSLLFLEPSDQLIAWRTEDLDEVLRKVDQHLAAGAFVAGVFHYECGNHFVGIKPGQSLSASTSEPIAWLGVFNAPIEFDHSTGKVRGTLPLLPLELPSPEDHLSISVEEMEIDPQGYRARFERIQAYLHAGDTYQVNFTDRINGTTASSPLAVYEYLLNQQPVPYAALINRPSRQLLSFSPELFFRTSHQRIAVRPMKGTWGRGRNLMEDREAALRLAQDEKNRSEHVMIVDLLRNDLGRICEFGSIHVDHLFRTEQYKTLLQMTSTISGTLRENLSPSDVFKTLFPSGSITGAPKRRTMEIIQELERHPRGIYTGSIGYFAPNGEACFNVAIRTMELSGQTFRFGVGGGITAGSEANEEYEECRLKAAFLTRRFEPFSLIETMRAQGGIPLLDLHMRRLAESAEYFDIRYDVQRLRQELENVSQDCGSAECRVRVELDHNGLWKITASPLDHPLWNGRLLVAEDRISSKDVFRYHKTTNRAIYDRGLNIARNAGFDEVVFLNERAELAECATCNLFLRIDGRWSTPALTCGVLPGVFRSKLLADLGPVAECNLHLEDLCKVDAILTCNALRGSRSVEQIEGPAGDIIWTASAQEKVPVIV